MAEFRTEKVLFHIVAQGSVEIEYEVGVETAEQAFRRVFTPANYAHSALVALVNEADDLDWVITAATEPNFNPFDEMDFAAVIRRANQEQDAEMENLAPLQSSERSGDNTTDPSIDPDGQTRPEVTVVKDRRVVNTPPAYYLGLGDDAGDSHADEDMARRDQFQSEQEELGRSIDQMLRGGER